MSVAQFCKQRFANARSNRKFYAVWRIDDWAPRSHYELLMCPVYVDYNGPLFTGELGELHGYTIIYSNPEETK